MNAAIIFREFLRQPMLRVDPQANDALTVPASPGTFVVSRHFEGDRCKFAFARILEMPISPLFLSTPNKLVMMRSLSAALDPTVMRESADVVRMIPFADSSMFASTESADPDVVKPSTTRTFNIADITTCANVTRDGERLSSCTGRRIDVIDAIVDGYDEQRLREIFRERDAESEEAARDINNDSACTTTLTLRATDRGEDGSSFAPHTYTDETKEYALPAPQRTIHVPARIRDAYYDYDDDVTMLDEARGTTLDADEAAVRSRQNEDIAATMFVAKSVARGDAKGEDIDLVTSTLRD